MKNAILITGASGGIGKEMAFIAAAKGNHVILVARSEEKLKAICTELVQQYKVEATYVAIDLAVQGSAQQLYREVINRAFHITYLVNNAGFGDYGDFVKSDPARIPQMIQLNVTTLTELTWLFARDMAKVKAGGVLNVASTASFQPDPLLAVYGATKAYVASFTEALSYELKGTGVTATVLSPGATKTDFFGAANMLDSKLTDGGMTPREVAQIGFEAMIKGKTHVVAGFMNKLLALGSAFTPMKLKLAVAAHVLRKK